MCRYVTGLSEAGVPRYPHILADQLQNKLKTHEGKHSERCAAKNDLFVPEKPRLKCIGFSYIGPKLFNMLPKNVKDAKTTDDFKNKLKKWIWDDIH